MLTTALKMFTARWQSPALMAAMASRTCALSPADASGWMGSLLAPPAPPKPNQVVEVEAEAARPAVGAFRAVARLPALAAVARTRAGAGARAAVAGAALPIAARTARAAVAARRAGAPVARGVLLRVHDAVVCLVDLVHALGRRRIARVQVRVVLAAFLR